MASPFVELEVGDRAVKVTNPDKVLFPDAGHTKRDLVDYYLAVGDGIVRARLVDELVGRRLVPEDLLLEPEQHAPDGLAEGLLPLGGGHVGRL